jgi:hypothetical protein
MFLCVRMIFVMLRRILLCPRIIEWSSIE